MDIYARGDNVPFSITFRDATDTPVDVSDARVHLFDQNNYERVIAMGRIDVGQYEVDWQIPLTWVIGETRWFVTATIDGVLSTGDIGSFTVAAGPAGTYYQQRVDDLTKVPLSVVSTAERNRHIEDARREYSEVRPRRLTLQIMGMGGGVYEYNLSLPALGLDPPWSDVNKLQHITYPADLRTENELARKDWFVYMKPDGTWWLKFRRHYPASGFKMWLYYTSPHVLTSDTDTILELYPQDRDAFCNLAASKVLKAAAAFYAGKTAATIDANNVGWNTMSGEYAKRSKDCYAEYERQVLARAVARTAGRVNWDTTFLGGGDHLFWKRLWT